MSRDALLRDLVREVFREELAAGGATRPPSVEEAARRLGLGRGAVWELIGRGEIASVRIGRRRLIPAAEIARLLDSGRECHPSLRLTAWLIDSLPTGLVWLASVVPAVRHVGPPGVT